MKKLTTKIISFILTLSMIFSLAVPAFAAENYSSAGTSVNTQEEIEAAREAYNVLTPEAQAIFDASLAYDQDMLEFHKTYVDASFKLPTAPRFQTRSSIAVNDPMRVLMIQLNAIGLPSSVLYSLKAMGAGMVAALADGPLPVGDILLAAATASTVIVIGANWDKVSPKFNQITRAFQIAFSSTTSNISTAFAKIKAEAKKEADKKDKKEVADAKKDIPTRLKDKNGKVKIGEFNQKVKRKTAYKEKGGWTIEKDRDGHKGSEWKLKNEKGERKASLKGNGEVVGK